MKYLISVFLVALNTACGVLQAQDFESQFREMTNVGDTAGMRTVLESWQKEKNESPECCIACYEYYRWKSRLGFVTAVMTSDNGAGGSAKLPENSVDSAYLRKAENCLNEGVKKFPDRLDLRIRRIGMYGLEENYAEYTRDVIRFINHSVSIKDQWESKNGEKLQDGKKRLLGSIQQMVINLMNSGKPEISENVKVISEEVLKYYPDHVESLINLSAVYLGRNENQTALEYLKKAEKLAPEEGIVLNNIAQAYKQMGDKQNALKSFELVIKYGDPIYVEYAKTQIEELKKEK